MTSLDEKLDEFATETQKRYLQAIRETGSIRGAASKLGVHPKTVRTAQEAVERKAAAQGYSPKHNLKHAVPEPFVARGHSTFYDRDGNVKGQWVKSKLDDQRYFEMLQAAADAMAEAIPRVLPTIEPTQETLKHLTNLYVMTDAHIGMLATHKESGADWNLDIAEKVLTGAFRLMLMKSPQAESCVIAQLCDWLHFDGFEPVTNRSGHVLDASARFHDVMRAGVRVLRRLIDMALQRHQKVTLLVAEGNHDQHSANWLQIMFAALYELEPRVEVIVTPKPYYAIQHGDTALFFTHGHLAKFNSLGSVFAADYPKIWGNTDPSGIFMLDTSIHQRLSACLAQNLYSTQLWQAEMRMLLGVRGSRNGKQQLSLTIPSSVRLGR